MSNDTFSADAPRPPKSNRGCMIAGIVAAVLVGGVAVVMLCCGGLGYFGLNAAGEMIKADLNTNPVVQEHVGTVDKASLNITATGAAGQKQPNAQVYDLQGTKANGQATLVIDSSVQPPKVLSGTLQLDSGETYDLFPAGEEAGGADEAAGDGAMTDGPEADATETDAAGTDAPVPPANE